ncbi:MAG: FHA domain-containing protein, partial [Pseudomonadota bacterium]
MVASSWRWPRSLLAYATSLLVVWASATAQSAEEVVKPIQQPPSEASGMVGNLEVQAMASVDAITATWRPLGPSARTTPPEFTLTNLKASVSAEAFDGPATLVFAIGGSEADIAEQLDVAGRLGRVGLGAGASIVLARLSPEFEVLAEVTTLDALLAALNAIPASLSPSADTSRTLPSAFQYAADTSGRKALFAGTAAFPSEEDVRVGIVSAALARDIYLFPVNETESGAGLQPYAEITGGRLVTGGAGALDGEPLNDFLGGQTLVFDIPAHMKYRLPGETVTFAALNVATGDAIATFELGREPPVLSWAGVGVRVLQPSHWMGWVSQSGRTVFGLLGLASNVLILSGLFWGVRRFTKPRAQKAATPRPSTPPDQIPDVTLAPLKKTIGRKPSSDYALNDPSVSRHHASLFQTPSEMWVADENSTNGSFIFKQGGWVQFESTPIEIGDRLKFGACEVSVEELIVAVDFTPPQKGAIEPGLDALQRFRQP